MRPREKDADIARAKEAALRYLSLRAYGERELYTKLSQRYEEHACAAAIAEMCELELLCDETFAIEKAKGMAERGKTPFEIRQKLAAIGIDRDLAQRTVDALDIDGAAAALRLVEKRYMDSLRAGGRQKVMAALARRGFAYRDIVQALEQAGQKWEAEETWMEAP